MPWRGATTRSNPWGRGLRAPDEVHDQHHEQDDHEDSDQAVTHICLLLL